VEQYVLTEFDVEKRQRDEKQEKRIENQGNEITSLQQLHNGK
jgi:hypothetical protein